MSLNTGDRSYPAGKLRQVTKTTRRKKGKAEHLGINRQEAASPVTRAHWEVEYYIVILYLLRLQTIVLLYYIVLYRIILY